MFHESRCDLDFVIYDYSQKALALFKTRARALKGNSLALYKRMIAMINQNVSEQVLAAQPQHGQQAQKIRKDIAKGMLNDGWI